MKLLDAIASILRPAASKQNAAPEPPTVPAVPVEEKLGVLTYMKYPDHIVISRCAGNAGSVEIPARIDGLPVTDIRFYAFAEGKLTSVTIPDSVTTIGSGTFKQCRALTEVIIPDSVQEIGEDAFCLCKSLGRVVLPETLRKLGASAFKMCESLTTVTLPGSITKIQNYTFADCSTLKDVFIPASVTEIGQSVFSGCGALETITLPAHLEIIGCNAFSGCSALREITIPASVKRIKSAAFYQCRSLSAVVIENPDCEICEDAATFSTGFVTVDQKRKCCFDGTLYGAVGSTAQAYAEQNGYRFACKP